MSTNNEKDITSEIPETRKLSREARKRQNKRLKWEQIKNEASEDNVQTTSTSSTSPTSPTDIVFNPLKV